MSEWIKVEDELPPFDQCVLALIDENDPSVEILCRVKSYSYGEENDLINEWEFSDGTTLNDFFTVSHWMPLPVLPE